MEVGQQVLQACFLASADLRITKDKNVVLTQENIALFRWPLYDSRMSKFTEQIQPVNELAEQSDGFIWLMLALTLN